MAKYLDPKADLTFKKVFAEHKELILELSENYDCPEWMLSDNDVVKFIDRYADTLSIGSIYYSIDKYWDQISRERTIENAAERRGLAKGREEGLAKGIEQTNLAHAKSMKALGIDVSIIVQVTGLTKEEINSL